MLELKRRLESKRKRSLFSVKYMWLLPVAVAAISLPLHLSGF